MVDNQLQARYGSGLVASIQKHIFSPVVDLIFPPQCAGCGRVDTQWCESCQAELDLVSLRLHVTEHPEFRGLSSTGIHEGRLADAVKGLKYDHVESLAEALGNRIAQALEQLDWALDIIVPVPLHLERLKFRRYNQAELIANVVSTKREIPCFPSAVTRWRDTPSQVGLTQQERQKNVEGAFEANSEIINRKAILLIDDVLTTGSTLRACASAIVANGASHVYGITVSMAKPN